MNLADLLVTETTNRIRIIMKHPLLRSLTASAALLAAALVLSSCSRTGGAAGLQPMFDGKTLAGWTPQGTAQWRVENGVIVCDKGGDGWLSTDATYTDFELSLEYRNIAKGNSGIFLRCPRKGSPYPAPDLGYELQINNEEPKWATGSIEDYIQRLMPINPEPNVWHKVEVTAQGDHFVVKFDGQKVLDGHNAKWRSGYIGLQYHVDSKIEFRNVMIKALP